MQKTQVQSLGQEDPLEKEMATHSSILGWENPTDRGAWPPHSSRVPEGDFPQSVSQRIWGPGLCHTDINVLTGSQSATAGLLHSRVSCNRTLRAATRLPWLTLSGLRNSQLARKDLHKSHNPDFSHLLESHLHWERESRTSCPVQSDEREVRASAPFQNYHDSEWACMPASLTSKTSVLFMRAHTDLTTYNVQEKQMAQPMRQVPKKTRAFNKPDKT